MKLILLILAGLLLGQILYWWIGIRFPGLLPRARVLTQEQLRRNWHHFLIGLAAWLVSLFAAGSLLLYEFLPRPDANIEISPLFRPLAVTEYCFLLWLAGRVWYSFALYRIVRDLWVAFGGMAKRRRGVFWGWIAVIPIAGGAAVPVLWLCAPRQSQRTIRWLWGGGGIALWIGSVTMMLQPWYLWIGLDLCWWGITLGMLSGQAMRLFSGSVPMAPPTAAERWKFAVSLAIPVLVALYIGAGWVQTDRNARDAIARAEQRITAHGVPPTPEEMYARYPEPADNAYGLYLELKRGVTRLSTADAALFGLKSFADLYRLPVLGPEVQAERNAWLANREPIAKLLDRVDPAQPMWIPHDWKKRYFQSPEIFPIFRDLSEYNYARLDRARRAQDTAEMLKLWRQLGTLHTWMRSDSSWFLVSSWDFCADRMLRSAEAMLNSTPFPDDELQRLMQQCRQEETAQYAALRRRGIEMVFSAGYDLRPEIHEHQSEVIAPSRSAVKNFLEKSGRAFEYFWVDPLRRARVQNDYADWLDLPPATAFFELKERYKLQREMRDVSETNAREVAVQRIMYTAIAAELYRRKYGAWPERLADLVPEFLDAVPVDPFAGQPLRMCQGKLKTFELTLIPKRKWKSEFEADEVVSMPRPPRLSVAPKAGMVGADAMFQAEDRPITRSGFRIYSVGFNWRDDGGDPRPGDSVRRDGDISFTWYDQPKEESL